MKSREETYSRHCPDCGDEIIHSGKYAKYECRRASNNKLLCKSCSHKNQIVSHETKRKISLSNKGYIKTEETKEKIRQTKLGDNNPMYGKTHSSEVKNQISNRSISMWKNPEHIYCYFGGKDNYETYIKSLDEFTAYKNKVINITEKQPIHELKNYNKRSRCDINKNAYHLDHKISIKYGFNNNINEEIIGNIHNLEFIPYLENIKKQDNCSQTIEELYDKIK